MTKHDFEQLLKDRLGLTVKNDRVDILRKWGGKDKFYEGYGTFVHINGKTQYPEKKEKEIVLLVNAGEPLLVFVLWVTKDNLLYWAVYQPKEFDMQLGTIRVQIDPNRHPARITLDGYEPVVKSLFVRFAFGEAVWVDLEISPRLAPVDEPAVVNVS